MTREDARILLVDDEEAVLRSLSTLLLSEGFSRTHGISDSRQVMEHLKTSPAELILVDLCMPHISGIDLIDHIGKRYPQIPIIVVTATHELETAVDCMRRGAVDFIVKPVDGKQILTAVNRALDLVELKRENETLRQSLTRNELENPEAFASIVTCSHTMQQLFRYVEAIADSSQPILITGETGTGKELMARAIHNAGSRTGEYVAVNVAGLDDTMFADTLFGHVRGAFTGADNDRPGLIERATDGSIFLDEIGELPTPGQVKLLRLLQEREYYAVGADTPRRTNARIIVATNADLGELVDRGDFRRDLFYRLQTHHIHIPPLRERREDLPRLFSHFLNVAADDQNKPVPAVPDQLISTLRAYDFPGNVRELQSLIHDAVSRHDKGIMSLDRFRDLISPSPFEEAQPGFNLESLEQLPPLRAAKGIFIKEALRRAENNHGLAAQLLGVTRQAISKYIREHPDEF